MSQTLTIYSIPQNVIDLILEHQNTKPQLPNPKGCFQICLYLFWEPKEFREFYKWETSANNYYQELEDKYGPFECISFHDNFNAIHRIILGPDYTGVPPVSYLIGAIPVWGIENSGGYNCITTLEQTKELSLALNVFTEEKISELYDRESLEEDLATFMDNPEEELNIIIEKINNLKKFLQNTVKKECGTIQFPPA